MVKIKNILIIFLAIIFLAILVLAADYYKVVTTFFYLDIDEHGVCKSVNNYQGVNDLFVPTKTLAEWSSFYSNYPAGVGIDNCPECRTAGDCTSVYPDCAGIMDCGGGNCCTSGLFSGICPSLVCIT